MRLKPLTLLLLLSGSAFAQLPITQMPQMVLPPTGNELLTLVQGGFTVGTCPNVGQTGLCNVQATFNNLFGTLTNVNIVNGNLGKPSFIDLTNAINAPSTSFPACGPFSVVSNNLSSSATPACNSTLSIQTIIVPNGATISTTGTGLNTANALAAGTSLAPAVGLPLTTGVSGILPIANGGNGTATPVISAGTNITVTGTWPTYTITASSTAATAFSAITGATNVAAAMVVGTGASLDYTGAGTIDANLVSGAAIPTSAGFLGTNGSNQLGAVTSGTLSGGLTGTPISGSTVSATTLTTAGLVNGNVASASNVNWLTGASSGTLNLNSGTGTGKSTLGNAAATTEIDGAPINLNPGTVAGNVTILNGTSETGFFAVASGTTPLGAVSLGRTTAGNINIGDTTHSGAINIGNAADTLVDNAASNTIVGSIAQTGGAVTLNLADTHNVSLLTGASSGGLHLNDGTGTGATTLGNTAGSVGIQGGPVNINANSATAVTNIATGTTSGALHIYDGTGAGKITEGNVNNTTNLNSGAIQLSGNLWISTTAPTIGAGFGSTASFTPAFNSTKAFIIVASGTGQSTATALTAFQTAASNWVCNAQDKTTALTSRQTISTATAATITWSSAPTANDVLLFQCDAL